MPTEPTSPTPRGAVAGVLATVTGLAVGHLIAGVVAPTASPAVAVASRMIDLAPTPVKEWAVSTLGTNDKPVLITGVIVVVLGLGALIGALAVQHRWLLWAGPALLSAIAGAAAVVAPASGSFALLPAAVTFGVGVAMLWWLLPRRPIDDPGGAPRALPRRAFLTGTAVAGVGSAAAVIGGQWFATRASNASSVVLPDPAETLAPLAKGLQVDGLSPWVTPNADFYRVDISLLVPSVSVDDWRLSIDGMVDNPFSLTWQELIALPLVERDVTLNCVSNEVGGPYIGGARWLGVRTRDLLERAGVQAGADQVLSRSTDGFTVSTPIQALTDDRDALVAIGMNGKPLPAEHGFPARLITPGLYGYVGATKWLTQLTLTTYAQQASYWTQRGWSEKGPVKPSSRIDVPRPLARLQAGEIVVAGVAWAQHIGVAKVQVRIDSGDWRDTTMGPDAGIEFWRQWRYSWRAGSGQHTLECRVIDDTGTPQVEQRATPFPDGASGLQSVVVNVD